MTDVVPWLMSGTSMGIVFRTRSILILGGQLTAWPSVSQKGLNNDHTQKTITGLRGHTDEADIACDENLTTLEYADDTVLIFEEEEKAQVFLDELTKVIPSFGMHFAPTKCKVMLVDVQSLNTPLTIQGEALEVVERFTYLGSCISSDCSVTDETWSIRAAELRRVQVFDNRCLRIISRAGWCRRVRTEAFRKRSPLVCTLHPQSVMLLDMQSLNTPLTTQGEALEVVERFTYLGSCISSNCSVTD
ncbi:LOW QUALITY PROTEIN: hypothetical protein T265_12901 [Opisthorchis viverrini]|uniref:Reverse transcriptase domain-containing protein n=1 Tax=Opisthorchis viverrini TaxID=6198 RepID=A0A075AIM3_OPIVI|nr:LOW QUALITY PROTEIN: hypothetical protein T265_12901 [Opisthorchis viverrini]KER31884.1 LOW QUALITY PROTEIN: hypothetical protein T265_12901 [Opisthorchis viverrini]